MKVHVKGGKDGIQRQFTANSVHKGPFLTSPLPSIGFGKPQDIVSSFIFYISERLSRLKPGICNNGSSLWRWTHCSTEIEVWGNSTCSSHVNDRPMAAQMWSFGVENREQNSRRTGESVLRKKFQCEVCREFEPLCCVVYLSPKAPPGILPGPGESVF